MTWTSPFRQTLWSRPLPTPRGRVPRTPGQTLWSRPLPTPRGGVPRTPGQTLWSRPLPTPSGRVPRTPGQTAVKERSVEHCAHDKCDHIPLALPPPPPPPSVLRGLSPRWRIPVKVAVQFRVRGNDLRRLLQRLVSASLIHRFYPCARTQRLIRECTKLSLC